MDERLQRPPAVPQAECANCGAALGGAWCATCGQERVIVQGAVRRLIARQWSRIRHTVVALLFHPGLLTAEYAAGRRMRSIAPWRLTFNVVALFFALSFVTDFHVASFAHYDPSGALHASIVDAARRTGLAEGEFVERADRRFALLFTLLVPCIVVVIAAAVALTHRGWRFGNHVVFALHFTAWASILDAVYQGGMSAVGVPPFVGTSDAVTLRGGLAWLLVFEALSFAYLLLALRRVYADGLLAGSIKAVLVLVTRLITANAAVFLATWIAIRSI